MRIHFRLDVTINLPSLVSLIGLVLTLVKLAFWLL